MQPKGILSEIPAQQDLPSEIKAAINENVLFDVINAHHLLNANNIRFQY